MTLSDLPLGEFLERLAAREPAPGGGAAAALTAALAAGLVAMSARFSRTQLTDDDADTRAAAADRIRGVLVDLAERDGAAYHEVLAAFRESEQPDPQARRERIRAALDRAARVPLEIAETAADLAAQAGELVERGNPNLRGDAGAAVHLAAAAAAAAAALVRLNVELGDLDTDLATRADRAAPSRS